MTPSTPESRTALTDLIQTVARLRAPGGCSWDRAQTHQSLRQYLIEEAYEVLDVLDQIESPESLRNEKIRGAFREELGDLLMQVVLHSEMASETGAFDLLEVAATLNDKLIRRHPHVFGDAGARAANSSEETAFQAWEKQKAKEKASNPTASVLDGVPRNLPALQKASRVIEKVTKVGFQWNDMSGPLAKMEEELAEVKAEIVALEALTQAPAPHPEAQAQIATQRQKLAGEMGDLLFTVSNLAYLMKINPEDALRSTLGRFDSRFRHVERRLKEAGKTPEQSDLAEMDRYWDEAKALERERSKT